MATSTANASAKARVIRVRIGSRVGPAVNGILT